jgi:Carbohydrate binding domain (family 11)
MRLKFIGWLTMLLMFSCTVWANTHFQEEQPALLDDFEKLNWKTNSPDGMKSSIDLSSEALFGEKSLRISFDQADGWLFVESAFDFELPVLENDIDYQAYITFWVKGDASGNKVKALLKKKGKSGRGGMGPFYLRSSDWEKICLPLSYFNGLQPKAGQKYQLTFFFESIQGNTTFLLDNLKLEWYQNTPPKEIYQNSGRLAEEDLRLLSPLPRIIDNETYRRYAEELAQADNVRYQSIYYLLPFTELETPFMYDDKGSEPFFEGARFFRMVKNGASFSYKLRLHQGMNVRIGIHTGDYYPQGNPGKYQVFLSSDGINSTKVLDSSDSDIMNSPHPTYQEIDASPFLQTSDCLYITFSGENGVLRDLTLFMPVPDDSTNPKKKTPSHTFYQTSTSWTNYYQPGRDMLTDDVCISGFKADMYTSYRENNYNTIGLLLSLKSECIQPSPTDAEKRQLIKDAVDIDVDYVMLQEPFFRRSGTDSQEFKDLWTELFNSPWQDPASSIDNRYKLEKMRTVYWQRRINEFGGFLKECNEENDVVAKFFIAVHSPINYLHWKLTYPHAQTLLDSVIDAVVGQVWSDTSRQNIMYQGRSQERTFDYAFMEYSYFYNLFRGTDKELWFLHDPASDIISWERRSWSDYQRWYEGTLFASLFFPEVSKFEVIPWPERIFMWKDLNGIIALMGYRMEILSAIRALEDMHNQTSIAWDCGTTEIAVPIADSMGWQHNPHQNTLDSFFGITLPLFNAGIPVQTIPLERSIDNGYLEKYKMLLLSYDMYKPLTPEYNQAIADWVMQGGNLMFFGGSDEYNNLDEWWRAKGFDSPQQHLLNLLGIESTIETVPNLSGAHITRTANHGTLPSTLDIPSEGCITSYNSNGGETLYTMGNSCIAFEKKAGKGSVSFIGVSPNSFAYSETLSSALNNIVKYVWNRHSDSTWNAPGYLRLDRGKYTIAWATEKNLSLKGKFIDLLDSHLPLLVDPVIHPGKGGLFLQISKVGSDSLLHSNSQISELDESREQLSFTAAGPTGTLGITLINASIERPSSVTVHNAVGQEVAYRFEWDDENKLLRVYYNHIPSGCTVEIRWK